MLYIGIAIAVGLIGSVISADELTGGKTLSWLDIPLFVGGGYVAQILSFGDTHPTEWSLILQYISLALTVDSVVMISLPFAHYQLLSAQVVEMIPPRIQQALAADGAIASFSSNLFFFRLNPDRAPQLKRSVMPLRCAV